MKKIVILLLAMVTVIPLASNAATPRMITQTQCNAQVNVYKAKYNNAIKMIGFFQSLSYSSADYVGCLWGAMRDENTFPDCDMLFDTYVGDRNAFYENGMLSYSIKVYN